MAEDDDTVDVVRRESMATKEINIEFPIMGRDLPAQLEELPLPGPNQLSVIGSIW
jgi:hypothetical protein